METYPPRPFWTQYEPHTGWCTCSCGARRKAAGLPGAERDADADRWLADHTAAHEAVAGLA